GHALQGDRSLTDDYGSAAGRTVGAAGVWGPRILGADLLHAVWNADASAVGDLVRASAHQAEFRLVQARTLPAIGEIVVGAAVHLVHRRGSRQVRGGTQRGGRRHWFVHGREEPLTHVSRPHRGDRQPGFTPGLRGETGRCRRVATRLHPVAVIGGNAGIPGF